MINWNTFTMNLINETAQGRKNIFIGIVIFSLVISIFSGVLVIEDEMPKEAKRKEFVTGYFCSLFANILMWSVILLSNYNKEYYKVNIEIPNPTITEAKLEEVYYKDAPKYGTNKSMLRAEYWNPPANRYSDINTKLYFKDDKLYADLIMKKNQFKKIPDKETFKKQTEDYIAYEIEQIKKFRTPEEQEQKTKELEEFIAKGNENKWLIGTHYKSQAHLPKQELFNTFALPVTFMIVILIYLFEGMYPDSHRLEEENQEIKRLSKNLILATLILFGSYFIIKAKTPYYAITVETDKPVGIETQIAKVQENEKYLDHFQREQENFRTIDIKEKDNKLEITTAIKKEKYAHYKSVEDFKTVLVQYTDKQLEYIKNYKT